MIESSTLQVLIELSQRKNQSALRRFGQLNQQHQSEQGKLELLLQFRLDYQSRFQAAQAEGLDSVSLQNFQNFLNRLDEAVKQQQQLMLQANQRLEVGRDGVHQSHRVVRTFDTLAQTQAETQRMNESRQEQKALDEQINLAQARKSVASE